MAVTHSSSAAPAADFRSVPLREVETRLNADRNGLTREEAARRFAEYGPNAIAERQRNVFLQFLKYFWGPIPWMIEAALILSALVGHWPDFFVILTLLAANAVIGFSEEHQAGNAIAALKAKLALKATVLRDGTWTACPAEEIVPGDVIHMRLGDIVPADARLLDGGDPVEIDQSSLTGESLPVTKNPEEPVFSGSIMKRGEAEALVYATGRRTFFGKTVQLVGAAHTGSHFERAVLRIGNYLIVLAAVLVVIILGVAVRRGDPLLTTLEFALILLVAAIPVAMPTVLSVTMAAGARLLAKRQAVVSRLTSIEELAGMDVLCSDKTGTLTKNSLALGAPFTLPGITVDELVLCGALASRSEDDDAIDRAVIAGVKDKAVLRSHQVLRFTPFDPRTKRTEAEVRTPDGTIFRVAMGAAETILALPLAPGARAAVAAVDAAVDGFARRGFRSLAVARAAGAGIGAADAADAAAGGAWELLGVLSLSDPPRDDAKSTIATAREMGVDVKMVTGDQRAIAAEIAGQLGLGTNIMRAAVLDGGKAAASGTGAAAPVMLATDGEAIEHADGFAEVFPEHKFNIVKALQDRGHIVGMTGDGVNDAPALREADCGVAVSGATDAARAAADIVLLTEGLSVIIDAIKESRKIFQHMTSYSIYRIGETIRVLLFMTLAILIFNFYPVTAIMIVLLALLNDGAVISIAYDNVDYSRRPEKWNMRTVLGISTVLGVIGVVASFGMFWLGERVFHLDRATIQTVMYLKLSVAGQLTIFITRVRGHFWSKRPGWLLIGAVSGAQVIATLFSVYGIFMPPIGWGWAGFVWGYAVAWAVVNDFVKIAAYRVIDPVRKKGASAGTPPSPIIPVPIAPAAVPPAPHPVPAAA